MRLKEMKIDPATMQLNVDIINKKEAFAIVVCDGKARMTKLPEHGETVIVTHQGKVKRVKWDEGEEF
ncbi:MAG: hypothetical protein K0R18_2771 [Bacillales bacterium]|nr:hypothetical protein [Bacillales bacterium]